jgi:hypothetical protein
LCIASIAWRASSTTCLPQRHAAQRACDEDAAIKARRDRLNHDAQRFGDRDTAQPCFVGDRKLAQRPLARAKIYVARDQASEAAAPGTARKELGPSCEL